MATSFWIEGGISIVGTRHKDCRREALLPSGFCSCTIAPTEGPAVGSCVRVCGSLSEWRMSLIALGSPREEYGVGTSPSFFSSSYDLPKATLSNNISPDGLRGMIEVVRRTVEKTIVYMASLAAVSKEEDISKRWSLIPNMCIHSDLICWANAFLLLGSRSLSQYGQGLTSR